MQLVTAIATKKMGSADKSAPVHLHLFNIINNYVNIIVIIYF